MMSETKAEPIKIKIRIKNGIAVNVSKYDQYMIEKRKELKGIEVNESSFTNYMSFVNELTAYLDADNLLSETNTASEKLNIYDEINEAIVDIALAALDKTKNYLDDDF